MSGQLLSVSALNHQMKALVEATFLGVYVGGEISNITYHSSGHLYFSIKDETSSVRCVMFKAQASRLKFRLENGLKVIITGSVTLYVPRGEYQIQVSNVEPDGAGSLSLAFEQLKTKLQSLGYFDENHKKPLPLFPKKVGIATSATGAALQDMIRVATLRWPLVKLVVINTVVQGELGKSSLVNAIKKLDTMECDVIVVGRGGGSMEDLWCFNEEDVAHAIYQAQTPIVSAVGHETDWVMSDFVADQRAPTPSAAMQIILPDHRDVSMMLDEVDISMKRVFRQLLLRCDFLLRSVGESLDHFNPLVKLSFQKKEIQQLSDHLALIFSRVIGTKKEGLIPLIMMGKQSISHHFQTQDHTLYALKEQLELLNPSLSLRPQSAIVHKENKKVPLNTLRKGDQIVLEDMETAVVAHVIETKKVI